MGFWVIRSPLCTDQCLMTRREHPGNKERSCIPLPFSRLAADDEMSEAAYPQCGAWWMLSRWADRCLPCRHPAPGHSACPRGLGSWLVEVMAPVPQPGRPQRAVPGAVAAQRTLIKQGWSCNSISLAHICTSGRAWCLPLGGCNWR